MWALDNRTPYAADRNWIRDKDGAHHWLVAVKATFDVGRDGKLKLADEQPPPALEPQYRGEPGKSSLRVDSDLLEAKPGTDVVLDASAHAPKGRPATSVPVALRIAELEKILVVHGIRAYYKGPFGLTASGARPFTTQPIQYEWAYGGADLDNPDPRKQRIDLRNPIGRGFAAAGGRIENEIAHAIEYPKGDAAGAGPAGFGPIDRAWSPRFELAGTYDARWEKNKKPLLPDDYDERYAFSAPVDQRFGRPLRGGEQVALVNLTPEGALTFDLPRIALSFTTQVAGRREEHGATLTTVFMVPDEKRIHLVWQSTLRVRAREIDYVDATTIVANEDVR
jgi:hypothetical protein